MKKFCGLLKDLKENTKINDELKSILFRFKYENDKMFTDIQNLNLKLALKNELERVSFPVNEDLKKIESFFKKINLD